MNTETHELWSWNESNARWLAIDQGTAATMREAAERRYASARKFDMAGSAFVARKIGNSPEGHPADIGVEVTTAPEPDPAPEALLVHLESTVSIQDPPRMFLRILDGDHNMWAEVTLSAEEWFTLSKGGGVKVFNERKPS